MLEIVLRMNEGMQRRVTAAHEADPMLLQLKKAITKATVQVAVALKANARRRWVTKTLQSPRCSTTKAIAGFDTSTASRCDVLGRTMSPV